MLSISIQVVQIRLVSYHHAICCHIFTYNVNYMDAVLEQFLVLMLPQ